MGRELVIDARYLEPPEPFVKAMEALDELDRDPSLEGIRLLIFREPFPLYKVLAEHGYLRHTAVEADGTYVITISRK